MRFRLHRSSPRAVIVLTCALAVAGTFVARADTSTELERARERLKELREQIADEDAELAGLQSDLNEQAAEIERARSDLERTKADIESIRELIRDSRIRLGRLRDRLSERAVEAYMGGPAANLDLLLGSETTAEFSDRMTFIDAVSRQDAELATDVQNQTYELQVRQSELDDLLGEQRRRLEGLEEDQAALDQRFAEQTSRLSDLDDLRAEAADLVARLENQLEQELATIPPPSSGGGGDGIPGPLFACPVNGPHAYADTFGETHVHEGWTHVHAGNDIMAPYGIPIVAPFDGTAVSGSDATAGIYVTVNGAQGFVQMLHMSSVGQTGAVSTGDVVGYIGTTGNASGPHTHFEWHPGGGAPADPYPQLNEVC